MRANVNKFRSRREIFSPPSEPCFSGDASRRPTHLGPRSDKHDRALGSAFSLDERRKTPVPGHRQNYPLGQHLKDTYTAAAAIALTAAITRAARCNFGRAEPEGVLPLAFSRGFAVVWSWEANVLVDGASSWGPILLRRVRRCLGTGSAVHELARSSRLWRCRRRPGWC